jgi:catechol 2,3-dioxygenase-like lactoylglutathione lyase family enzyme
MTVKLNHTIVQARDKSASAEFLAGILGLPSPESFGPFLMVKPDNEITLDFMDTGDEIAAQHYAFLVGDTEFDEIFGRIQERGITYWADPGHRREGEINTNDGGRGFYFPDPDGHNLEVITREYGSGG